jgi:hypothetical protein
MDRVRLLLLVAVVWIFGTHLSAFLQQKPPPGQAQRPPPNAQPARDRPRPAAGTAIIRGRVFAADSRAPLRRARVAWTSDAPGAAVDLGPKGVFTDAEGRYEISDLPPGRYRLFAKRTGYVQTDFGAKRGGSAARGIPTDSERGVTIDLAGGLAFDGADIYLPKAGVITGRILDDSGDPMIQAFVGARRQDRIDGRPRLTACGTDMTDD